MMPGLSSIPRSVSPAGPVVTINPNSVIDNHYGSPTYAERAFSLVSLIGTPASYVWSIVGGTGSVQSGGTTATATIRTTGTCTIRCATVISGVTYSPEASLFYEPGEVGGGSWRGGIIIGGGELA